MKTSLAFFSAFCMLALAAPVRAHHEHSTGYLVFWKGVTPKTGTGRAIAPADIWRMGFVSKFPILGAQVPNVLP